MLQMMVNTVYHTAVSFLLLVSLLDPPREGVCALKALCCHTPWHPGCGAPHHLANQTHRHPNRAQILLKVSWSCSVTCQVAWNLVCRQVSMFVIEADSKVKIDWRNVNFFTNQVSFSDNMNISVKSEDECKLARVCGGKKCGFSVIDLFLWTLPCPPSTMSLTTNWDNFLSNAVIIKMSPLRC